MQIWVFVLANYCINVIVVGGSDDVIKIDSSLPFFGVVFTIAFETSSDHAAIVNFTAYSAVLFLIAWKLQFLALWTFCTA